VGGSVYVGRYKAYGGARRLSENATAHTAGLQESRTRAFALGGRMILKRSQLAFPYAFAFGCALFSFGRQSLNRVGSKIDWQFGGWAKPITTSLSSLCTLCTSLHCSPAAAHGWRDGQVLFQ